MTNHIVIDARSFSKSSGGFGRYSQNLIHNLAKNDTNNRYSVLLDKKGMEEWDLSVNNFNPVLVDIPYYSVHEQTRLLNIIKKLKPDLVHYLNFNHPILYRGKYIVTIHDLTMNFFPAGKKSRSPIRKFGYNKVMKDAVNVSRAIIVPSSASKNDLINHLHAPQNKINVVYEAADDFLSSKNVKVAPNKILNKFSIKKPYLLFVSQWRPHKGIAEMIEAFKAAHVKFPDVSLVMTGKGKDDFQDIIHLVKKAQESYPIITTGFVDDTELRALYQEAYAFVFPSRYEGFGLPMLEAASFGCPIIASDASCMPEVMDDAALYFKTGEAKDLSDQIIRVLTEKQLRCKLGLKAQDRAKFFSWQKTAEETLKIYKKILNDK